ncbi:hypothetical protein [Flagellimonas sp.]|uniref:hypothetical protein n=1 Tax=Flagellimonas sp. TaxID=2058762 RepID=UPI003F4A3A07
MMKYFTYGINRNIVRCNFIYLAIGTLLFLLLLIEKSDFLVGTSIVFFMAVNIVNALMLLILLANLLSNFKDIEEHTCAFLIALLNYPIAVLFIYLLT